MRFIVAYSVYCLNILTLQIQRTLALAEPYVLTKN